MLAAAIAKDLALLVRDRGAMISLFLLPIVFIAVFGAIFGGDGEPDPIPLAVWHAPDDRRGAAIADALDETGVFALDRLASADAVREAATDDEIVGLVIPADLDPAAGRLAELLVDDAASPQVRGAIEGTVRAVITRVVLGATPDVLTTRAPTGVDPAPTISGFQITVPGNAVLFGFFISLTVGLSFVEERRTGTWRRILAAPASRHLILLAKLVPYLLVGILQFALLFGIGVAVFGMEIAGSPAALAVLTVSVVLCAVAMGLAIAAIGGTEKQVGGIGSICLLVMGLLGGAMVPRVVMPELMKTLGLLVPHGWALDGYHTLIVRPNTGLADVAPEVAAILGFAIAFAGFGAATFRFER